MKARAAELKAQAGGSDGEDDVLAKINELPGEDKALATCFHQLVHEVAPTSCLAPGTACRRTRRRAGAAKWSASSRAHRR
jgi:hypothetical protein